MSIEPEHSWGKTLETQMVPFNLDGSQRTYVQWYEDNARHIEWKPNEEFTDTLTYEKYGRGRSGVQFVLRRSDGAPVSVFMTDMDKMIPHMERGTVTGVFTFCKRGQNYGCRLVKD